MNSKENNINKTILIIYNLAILSMFLYFIINMNLNSREVIFTGVALLVSSLFIPYIIFLRQWGWGRYSTPYEEEIISPILKGLKSFKKCNNIEKWFAITYVFWAVLAFLITVIGLFLD